MQTEWHTNHKRWRRESFRKGEQQRKISLCILTVIAIGKWAGLKFSTNMETLICMFPLPLHVCMYVCVFMYSWGGADTHVYICTCVRKPEMKIGSFPQLLFSLASLLAQGFPVSAFWGLGLQWRGAAMQGCHACLVLMWVPRTQTLLIVVCTESLPSPSLLISWCKMQAGPLGAGGILGEASPPSPATTVY